MMTNHANSTTQAMALDAACRLDFETFAERVFRFLDPGTPYHVNWHTKSIHWHLDLIRQQTINRLIIAQPPRTGKSIAASIAFPAFVHGHDPNKRIICASYSQELATKLHNDYRKIMESRWYKRLFPRTRISPRKDTNSYTELTDGGTRIATSVGGVLTGLGADIIVVDDPLKASDAYSDAKRNAVNDWYGSTLYSRLNDKKSGAIVVVSQRLHLDDLIGHLQCGRQDWERLILPAIAQEDMKIDVGDYLYHLYRRGEVLNPARETLAMLEELRTLMGSDMFSAQYLQAPVPPGGNMFKRAWVKRYDQIPMSEDGDEILQSWDTASKDGPANDWSVCTTFLKRAGLYYLIDCFRARLEYPQLRTKAIQLAWQHGPRLVIVEDTGVGTALVAELRNSGINVWPNRPEKGKEARAAVQAATFEGGRVYLPNKAPWLEELEAELFAFPGGRHDDQVELDLPSAGARSEGNDNENSLYPHVGLDRSSWG